MVLQLLVAVMGIWLTVSYVVLDEREKTAQFVVARGDVAATNFLAYRQAVVTYRTANPTATGTVPDGALTWQTGFIRDGRWTNLISGGELYVYSLAAPEPAVLQAVFMKAGSYVMVGTKNASGNLVNAGGSTIAISLPAGIPVGSIVYVGG